MAVTAIPTVTAATTRTGAAAGAIKVVSAPVANSGPAMSQAPTVSTGFGSGFGGWWLDRLWWPVAGSRLCIRVWGVALGRGSLAGSHDVGLLPLLPNGLLGGQIRLASHRVFTKPRARAGW